MKCRPHYDPREFTQVIVIEIYIPPQVDIYTALTKLHETLIRYESDNLDAVLIVTDDFNKVMPNFYQQITCKVRRERTLDHC